MNAESLMKCLKIAIQTADPILIKGKPGVGKSTIVADLCKDLQVDLALFHPAVEEPTDVKGFPWCVQVGERVEAKFITYGEMARLLNPKRRMVALIDDLGQSDESMQAAWMQPLHARELNGIKISPNVSFLAATNDITDKAGVSGLLEPLKSRFKSIITYEPNHEDWITWAYNNKMPPMITSFIRFRPELLHKADPTKEIRNSPCPRTVAALGDILNHNYPPEALFELAEGAVGPGFTAEFLAFRALYGKMPDPQDCIDNPTTAEVPDPDEPGITYALCGAMARKVTMKNLGGAIAYIDRIPVEFAVLFIKDLKTLHPKIMSQKVYVDWLLANKTVLL